MPKAEKKELRTDKGTETQRANKYIIGSIMFAYVL
jgi:hypothetical protein